jgi:glycosyltransferase involved in cell wall biosynthesis
MGNNERAGPGLAAGCTLRNIDSFLLSIVVPMYNEEETVDRFLGLLLDALELWGGACEVICIDDGSTDLTLERVLASRERDPRVQAISLTRNFGKEAALSAGIDHCSGDAVIAIDADLQHPPELIPRMIALWAEGWDVVAARRRDRSQDGLLRHLASRLFYHAFNRIADREIPPEIGDYRLMDAAVIRALRTLPERNRFMKGLFAWVGFRGTTIAYDVAPHTTRLCWFWSGFGRFFAMPGWL